jgi:hypothetical protein
MIQIGFVTVHGYFNRDSGVTLLTSGFNRRIRPFQSKVPIGIYNELALNKYTRDNMLVETKCPLLLILFCIHPIGTICW